MLKLISSSLCSSQVYCRDGGKKKRTFGKAKETDPMPFFFERDTSTNATAWHPDGKEFNLSNIFAVIEQVRMAVFLAKGKIS